MNEINEIDKLVLADVPKVIENEQIYVYIPTAVGDKPGLIAIPADSNDFVVENGYLKLKWNIDDLSTATNLENGTGENSLKQTPDGETFNGLSDATEDQTLKSYSTDSAGQNSFITGGKNRAEGKRATAIGGYNVAKGASSLATGEQTITEGRSAFSSGKQTRAKGNGAASFGIKTLAKGVASVAEGQNTKAIGIVAHAEGNETEAKADVSHTEGYKTKTDTVAPTEAIIAPGTSTGGGTSGNAGTGTGGDTGTTVTPPITEDPDWSIEANRGKFSHAEGSNTIVSGYSAHAEGVGTKAHGHGSHTEGVESATAEKVDNEWKYGFAAHAEGRTTIASGFAAHAEGRETVARGNNSHSEGFLTKALGDNSHAGGYNVEVQGTNSFGHGSASIIRGNHSTGIGRGLDVQAEQTFIGSFNRPDSDVLFGVSNGQNAEQRHNPLEVYRDGSVKVYKAPVDNDDVVRKQDLSPHYEFIEKVIAGYSLLESAPSDFTSNYASYFKTNGKSRTDIDFNYVALTEAEPFEQGKYYEKINENSICGTHGWGGISYEPNGKKYAFTNLLIYITSPTDFGNWGELEASTDGASGGNALLYTGLGAEYPKTSAITWSIDILGNKLIAQAIAKTRSGLTPKMDMTTMVLTNVASTGASIRRYKAGDMPPDTTILIYGVRK